MKRGNGENVNHILISAISAMVAEASHFASSENTQTGTVRICLARSDGANDSHRVESRTASHIFDGDRKNRRYDCLRRPAIRSPKSLAQ
jgi:hypothetical protein